MREEKGPSIIFPAVDVLLTRMSLKEISPPLPIREEVVMAKSRLSREREREQKRRVAVSDGARLV